MSLKTRNFYKNFLFAFSSMFVVFASVMSNSNSFLLWGEFECPEELLK